MCIRDRLKADNIEEVIRETFAKKPKVEMCIRDRLGGDPQACVFFGRTKNTTVAVEPHRIHIALVVHLHNGRAVTRDLLLGDGLGSEALILSLIHI